MGNVSVLIAIGVGTDGHRRVLGVVEGANPDFSQGGIERGRCMCYNTVITVT